MKTILISLALCAVAFGQTNIVFTWNLTAAPTDTAVAINATQDEATAGANYLFSLVTQAPTTLTAPATSGATTLTLANVSGIVPGNGICFSPSATACAITMSTSVTLSTGEVARVISVSGNVVTVKRASIGTAAAYLSGQTVTIIRNGSYSDLSANILRDFLAGIISNPSYGSASAVAAQAAIAAAQSTLNGNSQLPH